MVMSFQEWYNMFDSDLHPYAMMPNKRNLYMCNSMIMMFMLMST